MIDRYAVLVAVSALVVGCASDGPNAAQLLPASSLATAGSLQQPHGATTVATASPARGEMPRKTMADKILTAIALERVTGLKPDASRLIP